MLSHFEILILLVDKLAVSRGDWAALTIEAERIMNPVHSRVLQPQFA